MADQTSLDDIFGSSPPHQPPHEKPLENSPHESNEPSELPSLRRQHVTAGYRDGISASKAEHVQAGFDAGFPIGAQLGMRAGTALGILEGLLRGYEGRGAEGVIRKPGLRGGRVGGVSIGGVEAGSEAVAEVDVRRVKREQVLELYRRAVKELDVRAVFAGFGESAGGEEEEEKPEVRLARKGEEVISGWEGRVCVAQWEENMDVLEAKSEDGKQS